MLNSGVNVSYTERLVRVEEKVELLDTRMARIEDKMDELLTLKNKGAGAIWLIGIIFGTSAMGLAIEVVKWIGR